MLHHPTNIENKYLEIRHLASQLFVCAVRWAVSAVFSMMDSAITALAAAADLTTVASGLDQARTAGFVSTQ